MFHPLLVYVPVTYRVGVFAQVGEGNSERLNERLRAAIPLLFSPFQWTELVGAVSSCKTRPMRSSCAICSEWEVPCFNIGGFLVVSLSPV